MKIRFLLFIVLLLFGKPGWIYGQIITTIAGDGTAGYTGDGGPATAARLNNLQQFCIDNTGNIFVADYANHVVRKINPAGIITTIAGTGTSGYSGDGGPATNAQLEYPYGICEDNKGNIYVSDDGHSVIRKIDANGVISTVAGNGTNGYSGDGGPAVAAQLNTPCGMCADNIGNIYIAEFGNSVIRKVSTAGIISTVAGGVLSGGFGDNGPATSAQLSSPTDVSIDNAGNLYIADLGNSRIRKVNSAGIITAFAGGAGVGYAGDGGLATNAELNFPYGVFAGKSGNVFIADTQNHVVRKVNSAGIIITIAGNGTAGYSGDGGPATSAQFFNPGDVVADNGSNVFIADATSHVIRKVGACNAAIINTQPADTIACEGRNASFVINASNFSGYNWQVNTGNGWSDIANSNLYSGANTDTLTIKAVTGSLNNNTYRCSVKDACGFTLSDTVLLSVTNRTMPSISIAASSNTICPGSPSSFTATIANGGAKPIYQWKRNGVAEGPNSNTYTFPLVHNGDVITCGLASNAPCVTANTVVSNSITITSNQTPAATLISMGNCAGSSTITVRTNDTLSRIIWLNGGTAIDTVNADYAATSGITVAGGNGQGSGSNQLSSPWSIFIDSKGNLYVADANNERIQQWQPGAAAGTAVATDINSPNQATPYGVYVDNKGNIYTAIFNTHRIQKWLPGATAGVTVAGGNGQGDAAEQFNSPVGVYVDPLGSMYITDYNNNRVQKWVINSVSGVTVAGGNGAGAAANQLDHPNGDVNVDANGNIYIADGGNYRVVKWAPGATNGVTVAGGNGPGPAANQLNGVGGLFVDGNGNIYIADASNHRIQKWAPGATSGVTVAGGNGSGAGSKQLSYPNDVFVTANGDIYIADFYNYRVQKWIPQLHIDTTFKPVTPGSYSALITNSAGCTFTTNAIVVNPSVTPSVSISASATTICQGSIATFTAIPLYGGSSPQYQWKVNGALKANGDTYAAADLNNGDTITCTMISNEMSCITDTTVISAPLALPVTQSVNPSVTISSDPLLACEGTPVTFMAASVNGGTNPSYQWQVNGADVPATSSSYATAALTGGDSVHLKMISNADCLTAPAAISNSIYINKPVISSISITVSDTVICKGSNVTFTATVANEGAGPAFQWSVNGINTGSDNKIFTTTSLRNGDQVSCVLTGSLPCSAPAESNRVVIRVREVPVISIIPDTAIAYGNSVILHTASAGNIARYQWSPAATLNSDTVSNPLATPLNATTYKLLVTSGDSCVSEAQVTVSVIQDVKVPNAFSPNGDGVNDVLNIPGLVAYPDCRVEIYNRYGALLFHSTGYNKPWNGTSNGEVLPSGTYYYIIGTKKKNQVISGWVIILK